MAIAARDLELGEKRKKRWANFQGFKGGWEPSSREQAIPQLISLYKSIGVSILDMMAFPRFALASTYNAGDGHIFDVVAYKFSEAPESAAGAL
ncbi:hypothetical protein NC652_013411 [Populus alba x Populus x berolinensis]|nr:hypothetical protein NC652_013411 [Populus alba x Populus x berolinensis]